MDGLTIGLTIGGIFVGVIVTYIVAKFYFNKSQKEKLLVPYIQFSSKLFHEIDPELKESLKVTYQNHPIQNLSQAQFVVANSGDLPIRDIIEPLRLSLSKKNRIFSSSLIHVEPEGRKISYKIQESEDSNDIIFDIPLLNKGEFFVFKIVYQDFNAEINEDDQKKSKTASEYKFTITADDLPPDLKLERLPFSYFEAEEKKSYDWMFFWITIILGLFTTILLSVSYTFKFSSPGKYIFDFEQFFYTENFDYFSVTIMLNAIIGVIFLIFTILVAIMAITEIRPDKKPKFTLPSKLKNEKERYFYNF